MADLCVVSGVPGENLSRGHADIHAVQGGADAFGKFSNRLVTEAGVSARPAGLGALKARLDAFGQFGLIDVSRAFAAGMGHPLYVCHWFLFPGLFRRSWRK
jgi:hypothetical protein